MQETQFQSLGWEHPLEKGMATRQCSCLENPMDRGAWWATVHGVAKGRTRLSDSHAQEPVKCEDSAEALSGTRGLKHCVTCVTSNEFVRR